MSNMPDKTCPLCTDSDAPVCNDTVCHECTHDATWNA